MSVRNRLSGGDYITTIPIGIKITLEYGDSGIIHKIYKNHVSTKDTEELPFELLTELLKHSAFPNSVNVLGGTTYVEGVLYTSKYPDFLVYTEDACEIPLSRLEEYPEVFTFYAITASSLASDFSNTRAVRKWLTTCKFNILPGYLVTSDVDIHNVQDLEAIFKSDVPFMYPLILSLYRISKYKQEYIPLNINQEKVAKIVKFVDMAGNLCVSIYTQKHQLFFSYAELVKFNIHAGSLLFLDVYNNILYSIYNGQEDKLEHPVSCTYCGRLISVPEYGNTRCSNDNCISVLYPRIKHFCTTLNLPMLPLNTFERIREEDRSSFTLFDIFTLPEYSNITAKCSIAEYICAILPYSIEYHNRDSITALCNECNNSIQTVSHYIHNSVELEEDFGTALFEACSEWLTWLTEDPQNILLFETGLDLPNIEINKSVCKFYGPPIFRDKSIRLTGKFIHGTHEDVTAILSSYSASVTTGDDMDCIVIGDLKDGINGKLVKDAQKSHIPIFSESEFFATYGIDEDLHKHIDIGGDNSGE